MIDFHDSPTLGQFFTSAGRTWKWNGTAWEAFGGTGFAPVATTGSYNDLTDKPTLGTAAATAATAYATAAQGAKADSALQPAALTPYRTASAQDTIDAGKVSTNDPRLSDARTPTAHTHAISDVTGLASALDGKQASGSYATLVGGLVPAAQLPSYVDDVIEAANFAALPNPGESGKIYVALDTGKIYRWSGSAYVEISPSPGSTDAVPEGSTNLYYTATRASAAAPVQSVAGRTGAVTLAKSDVGLSNVDNTSDAAKPISTATQSALDGKAASSHQHAAADITSGTLNIDRIPTGTTAGTVALGNHTHTAAQVSGLAAVATSGSAADLGSGTLPDALLSANVVLTSDTRVKSPQIDVYATPGTFTWTKPPGAVSVLVQLIGGGGSGGSGRKGTSGTACGGGSGGGGGSYLSYIVSASLLANSESVTIGAGGASVAGTGTLGIDGNAGGTTQFAFLRAPGGSGGQGGGGASAAGGLGGSFDGNNGGAVSVTGTSTPQNGVPSELNSIANLGGAGGGAGGSITSAGSPLSGGAGGRSLLIGLVGGTAGTTASAGGNGNNAPANTFAAGSGGGGGGGSATLGLAGGNGGFPGGGGGGGGATLGTTSGASGAGANGLAIITTFF